MSSRLTLAGICLLAAFGLAACGGGGGGTTASGPAAPTTPPPTTEPETPAPPSGASLALAAREAGESVAAAATKAMADATKYSAMLGAMSAKGDSATAGENAQNVLDAQSDLEAAIMDAKAAVEAAEEAKDAAEDGADVVASLESAIEAANTAIESAEKTLSSTEFTNLIRTVTGAPGSTGYPKSAAAAATAVAKDIDAALSSASDATPQRLIPGTVRASVTQMAAGNEANTGKGYNWGDLADKLGLPVSYIRVQRDPPGTPPRPTMSVVVGGVNGQPVPTFAGDGTTAVTSTDFVDRAGDTEGISVTMFGIGGTLYCQPGPCTVKDGKLYAAPATVFDSRTGQTVTYTPQWRFTPTDAFNDRYVADTANPGGYKIENGYVNYGYWISMVDDDGTMVPAVNTYAAIVGDTNAADLDLTHPSTVNPTEGATATYSGNALGVSSRQQGIESGKPTYASGEFTADVNLTAKFGGTATLEGTVNNFEGNAVDSRWSVALQATDLANAAHNTGIAKGDTADGAWTAQGHGTAAKRPSGFFGTFNANFANGSAAGGYATTRDTE